MLAAALAGLALGLSLIVAIGAQNLFVLRQGIRREHALLLAAVCAGSDIALIALGVSGLGLVIAAVPWLLVAVRWAGALFLVAYGLLAARRAWRPSGQALETAAAEDAATTDARPASAAAAPGAQPAGRPAGAASPASSAVGTADAATALPAASARHPASAAGPLPRTAPRRSAASVVLTCLALTWLNPHVYLDTVFLLGGVAATHGEDRWAFGAGAALGSIVWFGALALGSRHLGRWLRTRRAWRLLDVVIAVVMIGLGVSLVLPLG